MQKYNLNQIIEAAGDKWRIVGVGSTNEDGKTYLHLASTTRFRQQQNGTVPVQMADWFGSGKTQTLNQLEMAQALDDAIAETIDWIANEPSKEARINGDLAIVDAYAKIAAVLKNMRGK